MQRMSMIIHKHGFPDTYIYLPNFYAFSRASPFAISSFYENYCLCPLLQKNNMQQNQLMQNVSLWSI